MTGPRLDGISWKAVGAVLTLLGLALPLALALLSWNTSLLWNMNETVTEVRTEIRSINRTIDTNALEHREFDRRLDEHDREMIELKNKLP